MKVDLRALRDKIDGVDTRLHARIDSLAEQLSSKIESVRDSIATAKIWALTPSMSRWRP